MKHIKHWLATMAVLLCCIAASAHDFEVGGIYYNITSDEDLTVEVTCSDNYYEGAVTIPKIVKYNGKTYHVTSVDSEAFYECDGLTSITIPESVTSIGRKAFSSCHKLTSFTIPKGVTEIGKEAFAYCTKLTSIIIPESVLSIGSRAFYNCISLASITIPEELTEIGNGAFTGTAWYNNKPDGVVYINNILYGYKGTMPENTSVEIRRGTVKINPSAFACCANLISVTIPEGVIEIGDLAFYECTSLASIVIPEGVTEIGQGTFQYCSSLTSVTILEGVTKIGYHTFSNCISLASITLPKSLSSIHSGTFSYCKSLASIILPENMIVIGGQVFEWCSNLTSVTIPEGVTSIGHGAFRNCRNLTSINIPQSVTFIGSEAFGSCSSLAYIICRAINPPTIDNVYNYPNDAFPYVDLSIPLYVPESAISAYRSEEKWKCFTNILSIPIPGKITLNQYGSGTYCSEYALDFSEVEGLKAYAATGYDSETGIVTLTRVMTSQPGMGLFIKGEPGEYIVPTLESTSFNTLNMLVGTLENTDLNGTSADGLYANYKYTVKEGDAEPMFYQFADGSTLAAGRAYLQIPTAWLTSATAKSISYRFDDGETTDIEDIESGIQNSELIYDLMGRRVQTPSKGSVYIVNGKKIVY